VRASGSSACAWRAGAAWRCHRPTGKRRLPTAAQATSLPHTEALVKERGKRKKNKGKVFLRDRRGPYTESFRQRHDLADLMGRN
jgi:hypothetical protein